ncbi:radical SAM protein [Pseudodesulfovibrio sp. zrk46]|uniref:radical SAM protein n=1 Tax=Pseudodesulfovibrio sp. zrk46 TaxID=2725288 RepID=UPI00144A11C4|nr:radical SAM protein [Pseudodesulfovibrio sp. zrk46]QJB55926.1 radical SAM protein [Pseudodesulfovibrio sp. zrk46]
MKELIIELSHNCNLACVMCGFGGKAAISERYMTWDTLEKILGEITIAPERIRLNGRGESTIHPDFIPMMEHVQQCFPNSTINLFTNLSISNDHLIQSLVDNKVQLFISIDSPRADELEDIRRGAHFSLIEHNIELLYSITPRPHVIFTMQEANLHRLSEMAQYCIEKNMHLIFNTVRRDEGIEPFVEMVKDRRYELGIAYKDIKSIYKNAGMNCLLPDSIHGISILENGTSQTFGSKAQCPALCDELCILYDGTVTPCNMFNPYKFGNILEKDLDAILHSEQRQWFLENNKSHYYCADCACMGGTR